MKKLFNITGHYYQIKEHTFRKYLNIQKKDSIIKTPDLIVVMMNPGSSEPEDNNQNGRKETLAKPDNTQYRIMEVMQNCNYEFVRVLNLSDIREPKSNIFYKKIKEMEALNISHSIFDNSRKEDFNNLWVYNIPVIFGWGVNTKLKSLAEKAIEFCNVSNPYGHQKPNFPWAYYHPLPPNTNKQKEWVTKISLELPKI